MEWDDLHRSEDVQHLMAQGTLPQGSAAYSIARQAIDLGFATLSERQRFILDQVIAPPLEGLVLDERRRAPLKAARILQQGSGQPGCPIGDRWPSPLR